MFEADWDSQGTEEDEIVRVSNESGAASSFLRGKDAFSYRSRPNQKTTVKMGLFDVFKRNFHQEQLVPEIDETKSVQDSRTITTETTMNRMEDSKRFDGDLNIKERLKIIRDLTKKAEDKTVMLIDKNIVTYAVLCLFKPNRRKFQLT